MLMATKKDIPMPLDSDRIRDREPVVEAWTLPTLNWPPWSLFEHSYTTLSIVLFDTILMFLIPIFIYSEYSEDSIFLYIICLSLVNLLVWVHFVRTAVFHLEIFQ